MLRLQIKKNTIANIFIQYIKMIKPTTKLKAKAEAVLLEDVQTNPNAPDAYSFAYGFLHGYSLAVLECQAELLKNLIDVVREKGQITKAVSVSTVLSLDALINNLNK